mgnify:CR=1 FL=1
MPCNDMWVSTQIAKSETEKTALANLDHVTRLLCSVMTELKTLELDKDLCEAYPELEKWWAHHQMNDKKRLGR